MVTSDRGRAARTAARLAIEEADMADVSPGEQVRHALSYGARWDITRGEIAVALTEIRGRIDAMLAAIVGPREVN